MVMLKGYCTSRSSVSGTISFGGWMEQQLDRSWRHKGMQAVEQPGSRLQEQRRRNCAYLTTSSRHWWLGCRLLSDPAPARRHRVGDMYD